MRHGQTHIIIGGQGTGKSSLIIEEIMPLYYAVKRKILIMATTPQPFYEEVGVVPIQLEALKSWCRDESALGPRICASNIDNYVLAIKVLSENFNQYGKQGGCIFFEDVTTLAMLRNNNIVRDVGEFVINAKQINTDIWFVAHGLDMLPIRLVQLSHKIIMFQFLGFLNSSAKNQCNPLLLKALKENYDKVVLFKRDPKKRIQKHIIIDVSKLSNSN